MKNKIKTNVGRWTKEEKLKFKEFFELFGNNWNLLQKYIPTRKKSQIISFAQKYILKNKMEKKIDIEKELNLLKIKFTNNYYNYNIDKNNWDNKDLELNSIYSEQSLKLGKNDSNEININFDLNNLNFIEKLIGLIENMNNILEEITNLYNLEKRKKNLLLLNYMCNNFISYLSLIKEIQNYKNITKKIETLIKILYKKINTINYFKENMYEKYKCRKNTISLNFFNNHYNYLDELNERI